MHIEHFRHNYKVRFRSKTNPILLKRSVLSTITFQQFLDELTQVDLYDCIIVFFACIQCSRRSSLTSVGLHILIRQYTREIVTKHKMQANRCNFHSLSLSLSLSVCVRVMGGRERVLQFSLLFHNATLIVYSLLQLLIHIYCVTILTCAILSLWRSVWLESRFMFYY